MNTALKAAFIAAFASWTSFLPPSALAAMDHAMKCHIPVELTAAAEKMLGGAFYSGPKMAPKEIMTVMKKAHQVHHPQYGGAFFMAPNKMNHVEVVYSKACGARVYLFNAYTKPIRANRSQAFVEFVPLDDNEAEATRFLQPSKNGDYLATGANHGVKPPFDIRLHMKFPDSDEVEIFTVKLEVGKKHVAAGVGTVVRIDLSAGKLVIDHKAIPGYMGAMTMPYAVSNPDLLKHVKPGMNIRFRVDKKKNVIIGIDPIGG